MLKPKKKSDNPIFFSFFVSFHCKYQIVIALQKIEVTRRIFLTTSTFYLKEYFWQKKDWIPLS